MDETGRSKSNGHLLDNRGVQPCIGLCRHTLRSSCFFRAWRRPGQNDERSARFQRATPESVRLSPEKIRTGARRCARVGRRPGGRRAQVLLIKDGKIILNEGVGWRDRESRLKMEPNTICCVRSMTKPVVGTAVQMLIDEGKLALTDRASKYLPSFDNAKSRNHGRAIGDRHRRFPSRSSTRS